MRLYTFRDFLRYDEDEEPEEDRGYSLGSREKPGYGVTLYFAEGEEGETEQRHISDSFSIARVFDLVSAIATIIKGAGRSEASRGITAWFARGDPIIQFFRNCIDGGSGSARCLSLAKQAGIKYRRQNALALYNVLKLEKEFEQTEPQPVPSSTEPDQDLYERIRAHFREQFAQDEYFGKFIYEESELSEADIDDLSTEVGPGDFVFEVGELETATFKYYGHYHADVQRFKPYRMYLAFDVQTLYHLLKRGG